MINKPGISINGLPFTLSERIGTLLFSEYPTTIVYDDKEGFPIIKEWVDCSDDNKIDRFFFYKTSNIDLKRFIDGAISHIDFINSAYHGQVFFQDEDNDKVISVSIAALQEIPLSYKPSAKIYFNTYDSVDAEDVVSHFKLDEIQLESNYIDKFRDISEQYKTEAIYVHLKSGKGVGIGIINTATYGNTLLGIDKLYKNIALDVVLGSTRGEIQIDAKKNESYLPYTETFVFGNRIAASYGFFLKPISTQLNLFGELSTSELIAERTFNLLSNSQSGESLKSEYLIHSGYTINSFKKFLEGVLKLEIKVDLNWYNPVTKKELSHDLDYLKANTALLEIEKLAVAKTDDFLVKGKFRAVNCDTAHYHFESLGKEQYSGYFDKLLKEGLTQINFIDIYEVKISRETIKEAGKAEDKTKDTLISYYNEQKKQ